MAYFFSLRGWLEFEPEQFEKVTNLIGSIKQKAAANTHQSLHTSAWCWSDSEVNWTRYVFYGADVTHAGIDDFYSVLNQILGLGLRTSGYFHAQGEDGEQNFAFMVVDDIMKSGASQPRVDVT